MSKSDQMDAMVATKIGNLELTVMRLTLALRSAQEENARLKKEKPAPVEAPAVEAAQLTH